MESNQMLISALWVGIGIGVGLGLASGSRAVSKWAGSPAPPAGVTPYIMEQEMLNLVSSGRDTNVTFHKFPYYLNEQTRVLLTSAAFLHLKKGDLARYTRNLSPASRTILLSGPAEMYQQMLAKALAHYFEARLLLLDVTDFSLKIMSKYGCANKEIPYKSSASETMLGRMFGSFSLLRSKEDNQGTSRRRSSGVDLRSIEQENYNATKIRKNTSAALNIDNLGSSSTPATAAPLMRTSSWCFDEKLLMETLYKVLVNVSKVSPVILYLRDIENLLCRSERVYTLFQKMLKRLSGRILILGSRIVNPENDIRVVEEKISSVFPYNIDIKPPVDKNHLVIWKAQLEEDIKMIRFQDNKNHIIEVIAANDLDCEDLGSICWAHTLVLSNYVEEIVVSAVSNHLMNTNQPVYRNGKLVISSKSLSYGLSIFQDGKAVGKDTLKLEAQAEMPKGTVTETKAAPASASGSEIKNEKPPASKLPGTVTETKATPAAAAGSEIKNEKPTASKLPETPPDNEFEKRIRPEVIPANEIGVTFADIGALEDTKESLQELVLLPLRRPDLFEGGLLKPCRGILLFGPPGTGKTMLAKAIASEAGASFINVSMSTITSEWYGEDEKNVRALFTLAAKVSPTIIFVDEVDSMLGKRNVAEEHEAMRKIKNEFMTHWDGLLSKPGEKILVLAATNRPFDLDEAIIRRFERRIMVGLPSAENRDKILRTVLSKEKVEEGLDFMELAAMTAGYSGSDLKNLCITAAYRPVRELIQQQRQEDQEKKPAAEKGLDSGNNAGSKDKKESVLTVRPLNMDDFKEAKKQVAACFAAEGSIMSELKQWNDLYGVGGSRKDQQLSYFL